MNDFVLPISVILPDIFWNTANKSWAKKKDVYKRQDYICTKDLAYVGEDGLIYMLGRKDDVILSLIHI